MGAIAIRTQQANHFSRLTPVAIRGRSGRQHYGMVATCADEPYVAVAVFLHGRPRIQWASRSELRHRVRSLRDQHLVEYIQSDDGQRAISQPTPPVLRPVRPVGGGLFAREAGARPVSDRQMSLL